MKTVACPIACPVAMAALLALPLAAGAQQELWDRATHADETQHFAQALSLHEQLAQGGNSSAAEIAGTMLLCGEALYGEEVRRDGSRAVLLLDSAAKSGRPTAQFLV